LGLVLLLAIDVVLFGWLGLLVWSVQVVWVPFWSNSIITGFAHYVGYRKPNCKDNSRNLFPIGIVMIGEELHNNHHCRPSNPNLRHRWFEFDLGWVYIKLLEFVRLAKINY
jgi:stearoyl-CoA desaturase (delta-9 desaturase)